MEKDCQTIQGYLTWSRRIFPTVNYCRETPGLRTWLDYEKLQVCIYVFNSGEKQIVWKYE